jgi:hypothetical protein
MRAKTARDELLRLLEVANVNPGESRECIQRVFDARSTPKRLMPRSIRRHRNHSRLRC